MSAAEPALHLADLSYRYPARDRWTLDGFSLTVRPGEFVLVAGPTGCGKSTLVRCISGWIPAEQGGEMRGTVRVGGVDPSATAPVELCERLGIVLQSPEDQLFSPSVEDEIVFGLENRSRPRDEMARVLDEVIALLGLGPVRAEPVPSLSGGTKQRVAIGAMLALGPGLLVLDEPLSQLDPAACRTVMERLAELNRARGTAIVLVEHRIALAAPWCERVVLMDQGSVALDRPVAEAFADLEPVRRLGLRVPDAVALCAALGRCERPRTVEEWVATAGSGERPRPNREIAAGGTAPALARDPQGGGALSPASAASLLRAEGLHYRYGKRAPWVLRGLAFSIARGETVALLGANGSGKSTLLRLIAGLAAPTEGTLTWEGGAALPRPGSGRIGLVFQDPDLMLQARTVAEEVHWGPAHLGLVGPAQRELEAGLLRCLRLEGQEAEPPHALSRGQRQRVAVAAVLAMDPPLLCLDEPTTGQDRASVQALLDALRGSPGRSILVATQDVGFALESADRVLVLHEGALAAEGAPQSVLRRSDDLASWRLLAPDLIRIAEHWDAPPVRTVEELAAWAGAPAI